MSLSSLLALAVLLISSLSTSAQGSGLLRLDSIALLPEGRLALSFEDRGTGAVDYRLERRERAESGSWVGEANGALVSLGNGRFRIVTDAPASPTAFYRIVGTVSSGAEAVAGFSTASVTVHEGEGQLEVVIRLDVPIGGVVRYSASGPAVEGGVSSLTGTAEVNGDVAIVLIDLIPNTEPEELRYLTLDLDMGDGYRVGRENQVTVFIEDDDVVWRGGLALEEGVMIDFALEARYAPDSEEVALVSDGVGLLPEGRFPATASFGDASFQAEATSIVVPAEATFFESDVVMSLALVADHGSNGQSVSATEIEGEGTLRISLPEAPHLSSMRRGTFVLLKSSIKPSSAQPRLTPTN